MTHKWLEMRLAIPDEAVDLVAQRLMDLGCKGITAADRKLDTFVVPTPEKLVNDPVVSAYFAYPQNLDELCQNVDRALAELSSIFPGLIMSTIEHRELADHDWASDWQQHFPPFKVGERLVIRPSWVEWPVCGDEIVLTLDPGQAFGTGTHATTALCLESLADCYASGQPPQRVLDVGTGSGILAMAAAALGAGEVVACDIDGKACEVARGNLSQNQLDRHVTVTDSPLEEISGTYHLVLANILAAENVRLAEELVSHLAPCGRLVLSGILTEQEQQVIAGFAGYPLALLASHHRDEWTCIVYQRHE